MAADKAVTMTDIESYTITSTPLDAKGFTLTDPVTWSNSDPTVCQMTVSGDGYSAVIAGLKPGSCDVEVHDEFAHSYTVSFTITVSAPATLNITTTGPYPS